jgi:hypothetical protein
VPRSGLSYSAHYEAREAARFALLRWSEFAALDGDEQSEIVAHYRVYHQMEAVIQKVEADKLKNRPKGRS